MRRKKGRKKKGILNPFLDPPLTGSLKA